MPKIPKEPVANIAPFGLRLQPDLKARVARHAQENNRSMNSEIISLIEFALWQSDMDRMQSGLEPLREVTDEDWEIINFAREVADRHKKPARPSREPENIPFFGDEPIDQGADISGVWQLPEGVDESVLARVLIEENNKALRAALQRLGIKAKQLSLDTDQESEK